YGAAATPMYNAVHPPPAATPFVRLAPRVSIDEKNDLLAWGAEASMRMNLAEADLAPERELNEIIWRSVKGANAIMPPAVRSAFVRPARGDAADDDRDWPQAPRPA